MLAHRIIIKGHNNDSWTIKIRLSTVLFKKGLGDGKYHFSINLYQTSACVRSYAVGTLDKTYINNK